MSKGIKIVFATIIGLVQLSSCSTITETYLSKEYSSEIVGLPQAYINDFFGVPNTTRPDGNGGKVLIYNDPTSFSERLGIDGVKTKGNPPYVHILVNEEGYCYAVRTNQIKTEKTYDNKKSWLVAASSIGGTLAATSVTALVFSILFGSARK